MLIHTLQILYLSQQVSFINSCDRRRRRQRRANQTFVLGFFCCKLTSSGPFDFVQNANSFWALQPPFCTLDVSPLFYFHIVVVIIVLTFTFSTCSNYVDQGRSVRYPLC